MKKRKNPILDGIIIFLLIIFIIGAIFAGALGGSIIDIMSQSPQIDLSNIGDAMTENSVILASDGEVLEQIETTQYREIIAIEEVPQHVKNAFVAVEDERFYNHIGADPIGIVRSTLDNISAGQIVRGGSTITQQLARDLFLDDDRTYERKIKEIYIALKIEESLSKDEILELYLNRIFLGQNAYGIGAASETYFSKDVTELSLAEAAALASIPQAPTQYSLFNTLRPEQVTEDETVVGEILISGENYICVYNPTYENRQAYVLDKMLELGFISQDDYESANSQDMVGSINPPERHNTDISSYFSTLVKNQVVKALMDKFNLNEDEAYHHLNNGGLNIYSTIDMDMQMDIEALYSDFTNLALNGGETKDGNFLSLTLNEKGDILSNDESVIYFRKDNLFTDNFQLFFNIDQYSFNENGLLLYKDGVRYSESGLVVQAFYSLDDNGDLRTHSPTNINIEAGNVQETEIGILISQEYLNEHSDLFTQEDSILYLNPVSYNVDKVGVIQPQSSTVVIDHTSGEIKAVVGGRGEDNSSMRNRAYSLVRQPGSTMKPLAVYGPMLANGSNLATPIDDIPHYNDKEQLWPINWYSEYRGITTIRKALETSSNVAAVKGLESIGLEKSKEYLEKFHLINKENPEDDSFITAKEDSSLNDENTASMALGGMVYGFTNVDMTAAYAAIANKGTYIEPKSFTKITDNNGNLILENDVETTEVFDESTAFLLQDAMYSTTLQGIATNAQLDNFPVAGKTGTSGTVDENQDSWFIGFTPYYTIGFWMGADDTRIKLSEVAENSTSMWSEIGNTIHRGLEKKDFIVPSSIVKREVCNQSGKIPTDACRADHRGTIIEEYFARNNTPKNDCDVHEWAEIDSNNGLLASESTPIWARITKSFIKRVPAYLPEENQGILPTDWDMTMPTEYSTHHYEPEPEETEDDDDDDEVEDDIEDYNIFDEIIESLFPEYQDNETPPEQIEEPVEEPLTTEEDTSG